MKGHLKTTVEQGRPLNFAIHYIYFGSDLPQTFLDTGQTLVQIKHYNSHFLS